jgi:hypothetical protein
MKIISYPVRFHDPASESSHVGMEYVHLVFLSCDLWDRMTSSMSPCEGWPEFRGIQFPIL